MNEQPHQLAPAWATAFRAWFGLSPAQSKLLVALYRAGGKPLGSYDLSLLAGIKETAVPIHVYHMRLALQPEALDRVRSQGYRLSQVGMDECRVAIVSMASEMYMEDVGPGWPTRA